VALKLIYQMFAKLMTWMVLHTRSDTTKDIEILSGAINWRCCSDEHHGHRSAGPTEP
jgi:hypothetical protein